MDETTTEPQVRVTYDRNVFSEGTCILRVDALPVAQPRQSHGVVIQNGQTRSRNFIKATHPIHHFKAIIAMEGAKYFKSHGAMKGPVSVALRFYMKRPKSHYRSVQKKPVLKDDAPTFHTNKPDGDNLAKAVLDALGGLVWDDDKQVSHLSVEKWYTHHNGSPGFSAVITKLS